MSDALLQEFRALLTKRFGWRLENDHGELAHTFAARAEGRSPRVYLEALAQASPASAEVRAVAEALAVSETYFFRDPEQYAVLADVALPTLAAYKPSGALRILSAGSASGEEAYSIAMTVLRVRERQPLPPVEILGLDVSRRAVDKARHGRYSAWALRGLPQPIRREFFTTDGRHFDVRPDVAAMVRFDERNLLDLQAAAPGEWDIVFFRNTFMYFTPDVARGVLEQIAQAMPPDGFLFLGHAETLRGLSESFDLRQLHDTFFYVRRPARDATSGSSTAVQPPSAPARANIADIADIVANDDWIHEIARASERVASLIDGIQHAPEPARPAAPRPASGLAFVKALALVQQERHEAALAELAHASDPDSLLLRAVLLANMGRAQEARSACARVLAADGQNAGAYYVLALCDERSGDDARAVRHDEMAVYLDDTFAMPHLHMALIARRRGEREAAGRHARRARELFDGEDNLRIQMFGGGFTREALVRMCDAQLQPRSS